MVGGISGAVSLSTTTGRAYNILQENEHGSWLNFHRDVNPTDTVTATALAAARQHDLRQPLLPNAVRNSSLSFFLYLGEHSGIRMRGHWMPTDNQGNDHFKDERILSQWEYENVGYLFTEAHRTCRSLEAQLWERDTLAARHQDRAKLVSPCDL